MVLVDFTELNQVQGMSKVCDLFTLLSNGGGQEELKSSSPTPRKMM